MAATDIKAVPPVLATESSSSPSVLTGQRRTAATEATEDILYGSIAGIVGKYVEYPFDTVKVRLQAQPNSSHGALRYQGPLDCFRQSIRQDGLLGLYRGISAPLLGAALETGSLFLFERLGRETLVWTGFARDGAPLTLPALYFTGAFSGVFTSFLLTPIELVKCKIQVPEGGEAVAVRGSNPSSGAATRTVHRRPFAVIREVYRHDGLRGFWHGQLGTLIREAGGSAAWFGSKETTSRLLRAQNVRAAEKANPHDAEALERLRTDPLPLWQQALAGASAGMAYNFLFFPADTVKSRMQTAPLVNLLDPSLVAHQRRRRTFWDETRALWREAGVRGFYRGCGITVARSAPSSAFIFMVFDGLKTYMPLA